MTENTPTPAELIAESDALSADSVMNDPHEALSIVRRLVRALNAQVEFKKRYRTNAIELVEERDALAAILAEAPHDPRCDTIRAVLDRSCSCWKRVLPADALAARDARVLRSFVERNGDLIECSGDTRWRKRALDEADRIEREAQQ